jgi:hypothetical protein
VSVDAARIVRPGGSCADDWGVMRYLCEALGVKFPAESRW